MKVGQMCCFSCRNTFLLNVFCWLCLCVYSKMGPRGYVLQATVVLVCGLLLLLIYSLRVSYVDVMHSGHSHPHIHMSTHTFSSPLSLSPLNRSLPILCPLVLFLCGPPGLARPFEWAWVEIHSSTSDHGSAVSDTPLPNIWTPRRTERHACWREYPCHIVCLMGSSQTMAVQVYPHFSSIFLQRRETIFLGKAE